MTQPAAHRHHKEAPSDVSGDLERFFALSPDLLCVVDGSGLFTRASPAFERVLGHSPGDLLREPFVGFVHADDRGSTLQAFASASSGSEAVFVENRWRCGDGSHRWLQWALTADRDAGLVYAIARDVPARTRLEDEQAALRRVATLVARERKPAAPPHELFDAVVEEVGRLCRSDVAGLVRYESDGTLTAVAIWAAGGEPPPVGGRWPLGGDRLATAIARTGRPAREDDWDELAGPRAEFVRGRLGVVSTVGSPIVIEGGVWGALLVHSTERDRPLPPDTESRLLYFGNLVATAVANAQARGELSRLADEQAALRRVATLVAKERPAAEVFAAVAEEVGRVLHLEYTRMVRFEEDGTGTVVASWGQLATALPIGASVPLRGASASALVFRTGRPVRTDGSSPRRSRVQSAVGAPIVVDGRLWGAMSTASLQPDPIPPDTEARMGQFTELVAIALSNLEARSNLAASRARIAAAADEERRRVVRDLHDGAQQSLVLTVVTLKQVRRALENAEEDVPGLVTAALDQAARATDELRELAHGILPAVLTHGGLRVAVQALASRMPLSVEIDVSVGRLPAAVEATAYFVVSEALTNIAKHARAGHAEVTVRIEDGALAVHVRDDGIGGARPDGSGLLGLADRLAALDGQLRVESPTDGGTLITAAIPIGGRSPELRS
jgi:PAS domain S-box-containing protein